MQPPARMPRLMRGVMRHGLHFPGDENAMLKSDAHRGLYERAKI